MATYKNHLRGDNGLVRLYFEGVPTTDEIRAACEAHSINVSGGFSMKSNTVVLQPTVANAQPIIQQTAPAEVTINRPIE